VDYGGKCFWRKEKEHCASCFKRNAAELGNPLVLCDGPPGPRGRSRSSCSVARHRLCFSHPPSLQDLAPGSTVHFYCPDHLAQHQIPAHSTAAPRSRPQEPQWTPPPARAPLSPQPTASRSAAPLEPWSPAPAAASVPAPFIARFTASTTQQQLATPTAPASERSHRIPHEPNWSPDLHKPASAPASATRPAALRSIKFDPPSSSKSEIATRFYPSASRNFGRAARMDDSERELSDSNNESDADPDDAESNSSSDSSGDSSSESPRRHQSLGRRSAVPPRSLPEDDAQSMAASVLEAKELVGSAASARNVVRAPLTVRKREQAELLSSFAEHATLNDAQWALPHCDHCLLSS